MVKKKEQSWASFWTDVIRLIVVMGGLIMGISAADWKYLKKPEVEQMVKEEIKPLDSTMTDFRDIVLEIRLIQRKTTDSNIIKEVKKEMELYRR